MTTDIAYLVELLDDGCWHSTSEILRRSIDDRGHGLTVHSWISDLRHKAFKIEHRRVPGQRAAAHQYRLVEALPAQPARTSADVAFLLEHRGFQELTEADLEWIADQQESLFAGEAA